VISNKGRYRVTACAWGRSPTGAAAETQSHQSLPFECAVPELAIHASGRRLSTNVFIVRHWIYRSRELTDGELHRSTRRKQHRPGDRKPADGPGVLTANPQRLRRVVARDEASRQGQLSVV
jgi:hypothetical protein